MFRTFVFLHIFIAIVFFGPVMTFSLIGPMGKKHPERVPTLIHLAEKIVNVYATPADFLMPLTGALIIITSKGRWNPFIAQNRWLLAAIIIYIVLFALGQGILAPTGRKALAYVRANDLGNPGFAAAMKKQGIFGPITTLLFFVIIVLMVLKPGCGCPHA